MNARHLKTKLASACAVALLAGCSGHYSAADLAGNYALSVDGGTDTIELNANGTYTHAYKASGGQTGQQDGSWTLEDAQAGQTVVLNGFHPLLSEKTQGRGYYYLLIKRSFSGLYLITNIDLGEGYKKQS